MTTRPHFSAIRIIEEKGSAGSAPLLIEANDGELYYAKTSAANPPKVELINEVICNRIAHYWD